MTPAGISSLRFRCGTDGATLNELRLDARLAAAVLALHHVVGPAPKQHLFLYLNSPTNRIDILLPYTIGERGELAPVELELKKGTNTLSFHRGHYFMRGVTIRDFTLAPVK